MFWITWTTIGRSTSYAIGDLNLWLITFQSLYQLNRLPQINPKKATFVIEVSTCDIFLPLSVFLSDTSLMEILTWHKTVRVIRIKGLAFQYLLMHNGKTPKYRKMWNMRQQRSYHLYPSSVGSPCSIKSFKNGFDNLGFSYRDIEISQC